jgi:two-component system, LytTR family, sensor kinase
MHYEALLNTENTTYYRLIRADGALFWLFQVAGWLGISVLTYLSLSVPYDQYEWSYLGHNISQSLLGFLLSVPLRYVYRAVWHWSLYPRLMVVLGVAVLFALLWSALRLLLFMVMTGEMGLWSDFGGWLFPSLFVFFTWAALYHGIKYYQFLQREHEITVRAESAQRQEALRRANAEAEAREAQIQLLRYQLNPHFLFNTLNSVSSLVTAGRTADANTMLLNLSTFLRFTLENERISETTLREELSAVALYTDIEKIRFSDRLNVKLDIDPESLRCAVPSLLLQPIVENAIKHAIAESELGGTVHIRATRREHSLEILIDDTGPGDGLSGSDHQMMNGQSKGVGIGLQNTAERLRTLYGDAGAVRSAASPLGGMRVEIVLPATVASTSAGGV